MYLCAPNKNIGTLGKFGKYRIDLKGMQANSAEYEFDVDNSFFADIDAPEVQRGKVEVFLSVHKSQHTFELNFRMEGFVCVPCDHCLDDMEQPIASEDTVVVKFGESYSEEEDMIVVPEKEGVIDVAWLLYELIALAIPMRHVHALGKCNKAMTQKLRQHLSVLAGEEEAGFGQDEAGEADEDDETEEDGRPMGLCWNELKEISNNN